MKASALGIYANKYSKHGISASGAQKEFCELPNAWRQLASPIPFPDRCSQTATAADAMIRHRRRRAPHQHLQGRTAAGALPGRRRRVGHGAVVFAVGLPDNRAATKAKIRPRWIADRPSADARGKCENFLGGGQAGVGEGGRRGARHDGLFRRRRDGGVVAGHDDRRLRPGAAIRPGGSLLDLIDRHHLRQQEVDQDSDSARDAAGAIAPSPDAPRADFEQLPGAALCDAERVECRAESGCGHWQVVGHNDVAADLPVSGRMTRS